MTDPAQQELLLSLSGRQTVPQAFLGRYNLGDDKELMALAQTGRLCALLAEDFAADTFVMPKPDAARAGGEDLDVSSVLPVGEAWDDSDEETWLLPRLRHEAYGFLPNFSAYLQLWPTADKLFVYCHGVSAFRRGVERLGPALLARVVMAGAKAQGCSYCQVHAAGWSHWQEASLRIARVPSASVEAFQANLEALAACAVENRVDGELVSAVQRSGALLGLNETEVEHYLEAVALIAATSGFLNVFNGLTNPPAEPVWVGIAEARGIGTGRHGIGLLFGDEVFDELPVSGPALPEVLLRYRQTVGDPVTYLRQAVGHVPAWIRSWPSSARAFHAQLYAGLMTGDSYLTAEMKHLIARTFALAKGARDLAAEEAHMALLGADPETGPWRASHCLAVATGRLDGRSHFKPEEIAALKVAWLSAQTPLVTPRAWIEPALTAFDGKGLIRLFVICGLASMIQRFCALRPFEADLGQSYRLNAQGVETDPLAAALLSLAGAAPKRPA